MQHMRPYYLTDEDAVLLAGLLRDHAVALGDYALAAIADDNDRGAEEAARKQARCEIVAARLDALRG